jgi:hypothetical protein
MPTLTSLSKPAIVDLQMHRYRHGGAQSNYIRDEGLLVMPIMGPSNAAPKVLRVHAPYAIRESDFEYIKVGAPPVFPAQGDTQSGDTMLTSSLTFPAPTTDPGGYTTYGVRGSYIFVQPGSGRGPDSDYPIDLHPFPTSSMFLSSYNIEAQPGRTTEDRYQQILESVWNRDAVTPTLYSYNILR